MKNEWIKESNQNNKNNKSIAQKKKDVLLHLQECYGIITIACKRAGIGRTMFYEYLKDPSFKKKVDEINDSYVSYAETRLMDLIRTGDRSAIIFYLKAKGKDRGYC
ncbi:hypothetical protein J3L18_23690 [Mucilaginibacter gossypii]|uniref:hypothetical protein n=1 Tax=Mucilaginibacter gossypii TaxID=551996 RepID=UPI000DCBEF68|nr:MULTISPECIES: hypothetical protein [Mucilaginibacter]QTE36108.1 hypothetical protein J3L18_23690 [Mucilaginibacter gossypii]RAV59978.1 hypothetical protein DIU36_03120 [Mucilaginibacter rubeus]